MMTKYSSFVVALLLAGLVIQAPEKAAAFELFPRPVGEYTVKRGDTLYGIAGLYYSNPALWPFLWNQNPSVRMKPGVSSPEYEPLPAGSKIDVFHQRFSFAAMNKEYNPPDGLDKDVRFLEDRLPLHGIPYTKHYFKYKLSKRKTRLWGYIVASPDEARDHYLDRDLVYVRFRPSKRQCVMVGDRFGIYRERGPLFHPLNPDKRMGYLSEVVGEVEVTDVGHDMVTCIILDSYVEIQVGDRVCLFVPRRRQIVPSKTHRMLTGTTLVSATRQVFYVGTNNLQDDIVFVDKGSCDGWKEGMLINFYRPTHPVMDPHFQRYVDVPDRYVGEGMVLKSFDNNSTVLITKSREEVVPGDIIKSVSD